MALGGVRQCIRDVTLYLIFLIAVTTLGPLQFGFHLVCIPNPVQHASLTLCRQSLMRLKISLRARRDPH